MQATPPEATPAGRDPRPPASPWLGRGLLFVGIVFLLEQARPVLLPVAIAVVFAFVLARPVRALRRAGLHGYVAAGVILFSALAIVAVLLMLVAAPAAAWTRRAPVIVHGLVESVQRWSDTVFPYAAPAPLVREAAPSAMAAASAPNVLGDRLASEGWLFTRFAIGETIAFTLSASATVILLYFLLAAEQWLVERTVLAIGRRRTRLAFLSGLRQAERDIGLFIATMSIVNVGLGLATGLGLMLIGLPNPVLWGTTTAVLAFIPYLGPLLIAFLLLLAGSVTWGSGVAMFGPPAVFLVLHGIEANFLSPMIMGHRLRLQAVFVFLAVLLLGWLWGIAGAFIAVPVLLGLRVICRRVPALRPVRVYLDPGSG